MSLLWSAGQKELFPRVMLFSMTMTAKNSWVYDLTPEYQQSREDYQGSLQHF